MDNAGNLIAFQRLDGACVTTIEAATRKSRTAAQLGAPVPIGQSHDLGRIAPS